jgi:hypothetical protein
MKIHYRHSVYSCVFSPIKGRQNSMKKGLANEMILSHATLGFAVPVGYSAVHEEPWISPSSL